MEHSYKRQLEVLQVVEEQSGLATRQTGERLLSEFMTAMSDTPNISDRLTMLNDIWKSVPLHSFLRELTAETQATFQAELANVAWAGRYEFYAVRDDKGRIIMRARLHRDVLP